MRRKLETPDNCPEIWQVEHDINGNARYVVHYLAIPFEDQEGQPFYINQANHISAAREALHGKRYRAKWFGGGIVFQAYAGDPVGHVLAAIKRGEAMMRGEDPATVCELMRSAA